MFVSLCGIVCSASRLSASRLGGPKGSSSASRLGVPNWRPSASRIGVPNWRPELGPFQPVPNWGSSASRMSYLLRYRFGGWGWVGGVFQRVPTWGVQNRVFERVRNGVLFLGYAAGGVGENRVLADCGDFGGGAGANLAV